MRSVNSGEGVHMTTISNGGNKMFTHNNQLSTALILRKVPLELNTVAKLSNHFEKFGTVVNVQVIQFNSILTLRIVILSYYHL